MLKEEFTFKELAEMTEKTRATLQKYVDEGLFGRIDEKGYRHVLKEEKERVEKAVQLMSKKGANYKDVLVLLDSGEETKQKKAKTIEEKLDLLIEHYEHNEKTQQKILSKLKEQNKQYKKLIKELKSNKDID